MQVRFNRTFMELKCVIARFSATGIVGFNRTFMELKSVMKLKRMADRIVLIVPLWN